jgi:ADP-heptose:LPS heptosyltransferase
MIYYISFQALGDNLISLSFLKQLNIKANVLGTSHTINISKLIKGDNELNINVLFDDIPAFYDIRKKGFIKASKDLYKFIKFIKSNEVKILVFEKKDLRSSLVVFFTNVQVYYPNDLNLKVYQHRAELISDIYKQKVSLNSYKLQLNTPKKIIINPLTRVEIKNIKHNHLDYIITKLAKYGYEIYLIDINDEYPEFKNKVQYYLTNTTLNDVKNIIDDCSLYIGGDSFLIHLAYYLKRNYFIIFYRDNDDFLPPNIENDFYIKAHIGDDFEKELNDKFKNIGLIK